MDELVALLRAHPGWGPMKLLDVMGRRDSDRHLPLISTAAKLVADARLVDCIPAVKDGDYDPLREIQEHIADVGPTGALPASA